jgi:hypothetical protein
MTHISARLRCVLAVGAAVVLACPAAQSHPALRRAGQTVAAHVNDSTDNGDGRNEAVSFLVDQFRTRASFNTDNEYANYVKATLHVGWRVRACTDYEKVKKGMTGTYYGTNGGQPPCLVVWDDDLKSGSSLLPNVPPSKATHVYWVQWQHVEITGAHP